MKLGHQKGIRVTEPNFWKNLGGQTMWENPHFGGFLGVFLPISMHQVIKILWNFINVIALALSNTSRKMHVLESLVLAVYKGPDPYFWDLSQGYLPEEGSRKVWITEILLISYHVSSYEIWTGCTLGISIWRSKLIFCKNYVEGLISIITPNLWVFCFFQPLFEKSLRSRTKFCFLLFLLQNFLFFCVL